MDNKGEVAQRLLEDAGFNEAIKEVQQTLVDKWLDSAPEDIDGRESAYTQWWAVKTVRARLESWVADAQIDRIKRSKIATVVESIRHKFMN